MIAATAAAAILTLALPAEADALPDLRPLGGGAWSWFGDPRAIHHEGAYNRTYMGWIDQEGDIKVSSYDHLSGLRTTAVLRWKLEIDDHDNPSLYLRPDGRLIVFYSRHGHAPRGQSAEMWYRVSARPEDVTSWRRERTVPTNTPGGHGYTYPNPVGLGARDRRLFLFWRGGNWSPTFSTSPDEGETWSPARTMIRVRDQRPYIKYSAGHGADIHFAFTQAHPENRNTNIYYAYYEGGAFHGASGRRIGSMSSLPLRPADADTVYDTNKPTWIHDVAMDPVGRPVIVFAAFRSRREHIYYYARWTGKKWAWHRIAAAGGSISEYEGSPYYSGGLTLDHEDPSVVYLSREVDGVHEVEVWQTPDGGSTWTSQALTSQSGSKNVRPVSPRGMDSFGGDMSVIWMRGEYPHFTSFQTELTTPRFTEDNVPPIADGSLEPRRGSAPLRVRFDASGSRDPDGSIVRRSWDFGDGVEGGGNNTTHTYASPGRYFASLTVTDDAGAKDVFVGEVIAR